jgi:hypothetical protein
MSQTEHLLKRLPNDIGGLPAQPIQRADHELEAWEKRCHALADILESLTPEELARRMDAVQAR